MKILVCPSDETGCGKYRMIWPAEALKAQGHSIIIAPRPRIMIDKSTTPHRVIDVLIPEKVKVVVFQRPGSYQISQLIPILHDKGIKVVIDMDDDLSCIHPSNPAHAFYDPEKNSERNWKWAKNACYEADLVTATTEALLDKYAPHGRGMVLPNCVPQRFLEIEKKPNEMVTVGWAGWVATHPEDLQTTHGAVNEAIAKQNARFMAIGDVDAFNKLGIRNRPPNIHEPGVGFDQYADVVSKLDIGIVPLADTPFNRSKSWLKGLEYAALGVAPVVAPTPDNMRLVEEGAAYVARSPKAWRDIVRNLITNESERQNLAQRARSVAEKWTVEKNSFRWLDAWT